jgi:tight adherence protein B
MGAFIMGHITLADLLLPTGIAVLVGALAAASVFLLILGLQRVIDNRAETALERIEKYGPAPAALLPAAPAKAPRRSLLAAIRSRQRRAPDPSLETSESTFTVRLARDLTRADMRITVGEFMVMTFVLASVGALIGLAVPLSGRILLALTLAAAGLYLPRYYVLSRKRQRQRAFNAQLADVITMMANSLRAGFALLQAMELVAREGPTPVNDEFERVVREIQFGSSLEVALAHMVDRMESDDLELLVTAINVQREVGGNLVEVLNTIASTIRDRVRLVGEIRTLTAQQQFSGYIIATLPVALALLLSIINSNYMLGVFRTTTYCGWLMLSCSAIMILTGFIFIRQIVNIKA